MAQKKELQQLTLNLTSMLDVVFQLIIFFLLINNFSSAELPELQPPEPVKSKAMDFPERKKVTVNMIPEAGGGKPKYVKFGQDNILPGDYPRLTQFLQAEIAENSEIEIDLRVDKSIQYEHVQPVMNAITQAGIGKINLVALEDPDKK